MNANANEKCKCDNCQCGSTCQCQGDCSKSACCSGCDKSGGKAGVTGLSGIHNHPDQVAANLQGGADTHGAHSHLVEKQGQ